MASSSKMILSSIYRTDISAASLWSARPSAVNDTGPTSPPGRGGYPWRVNFRPGTLRGAPTGGLPTAGQVTYRLARNAVVSQFQKGRLSRLDVCDAHPELMRAARGVGEPTLEECPICAE